MLFNLKSDGQGHFCSASPGEALVRLQVGFAPSHLIRSYQGVSFSRSSCLPPSFPPFPGGQRMAPFSEFTNLINLVLLWSPTGLFWLLALVWPEVRSRAEPISTPISSCKVGSFLFRQKTAQISQARDCWWLSCLLISGLPFYFLTWDGRSTGTKTVRCQHTILLSVDSPLSAFSTWRFNY